MKNYKEQQFPIKISTASQDGNKSPLNLGILHRHSRIPRSIEISCQRSSLNVSSTSCSVMLVHEAEQKLAHVSQPESYSRH